MTAPAEVGDLASLGRDATLRQLVEAALQADVDLLVRHEPVVLADEDPEGVHQARVGIRRTRAVLRTFRDIFETSWVEPLDDELRRLGRLLGAVRDADVLGMRLEKALERLPEADRADGRPLLDHLAGHRAADLADVLVELRSRTHADFLVGLVDAVAAPVYGTPDAAGDAWPGDWLDRPARAVAAAFVARPWRKVRKEASHLHGDGATDDELHALRIRAKRARYAIEAVEPVMGKPARKLAKRLAALQDVLGDHHDTVVAEGWLRAAALDDRLPRAAALAAGQLIALERDDRAELRAAWPDAWAAVRHADTDWLRTGR